MSLLVVVAGLVAGVLGWLAPSALARVPEPDAPAPDEADLGVPAAPAPVEAPKRTYADLAAAPWLRPLLAVASALLTLGLGTVLEPATLVLVWALLVPAGLLLAYVDLATRLLPKRLVVPLNVAVLVLVALVAVLERDLDLLVRALAGAAAVFAVFFAFWWFMPRGLGYGDVRLSPALALSLAAVGWPELLVGVYAAFVLAAVLGLVLSLARLVDPRRFAFGPYLVLGAFVGVAWGPLVLGT